MAAYFSERWFVLLQQAVNADPRGCQGVSDILGKGFSRTMVSLVLHGRYEKTEKIAKRVIEVLDRQLVPCPYLGMEIDSHQCVETNTGPVPTWDPAALDQRRTCQSCRYNPASEVITK